MRGKKLKEALHHALEAQQRSEMLIVDQAHRHEEQRQRIDALEADVKKLKRAVKEQMARKQRAASANNGGDKAASNGDKAVATTSAS